jgi:hypothetical protein
VTCLGLSAYPMSDRTEGVAFLVINDNSCVELDMIHFLLLMYDIQNRPNDKDVTFAHYCIIRAGSGFQVPVCICRSKLHDDDD